MSGAGLHGRTRGAQQRLRLFVVRHRPGTRTAHRDIRLMDAPGSGRPAGGPFGDEVTGPVQGKEQAFPPDFTVPDRLE